MRLPELDKANLEERLDVAKRLFADIPAQTHSARHYMPGRLSAQTPLSLGLEVSPMLVGTHTSPGAAEP